MIEYNDNLEFGIETKRTFSQLKLLRIDHTAKRQHINAKIFMKVFLR